VRAGPVREFPRLVADGRITDAATLAAYTLLLLERGFSIDSVAG
jgi:hypothetical protein